VVQIRGLSSTSRQFLTFLGIVNVSIMVFQGYYIIFLEEQGLSFSEMGFIFAASMIATAVFDFPTGNVADKYGRKFSFLSGLVLVGGGIIVYGLTSSITFFLLAEIVAGLGMALVSGAPEAWLVDELKHVGRSEELERVFSASFSISALMGIVAGVISSVLVSYALNLPFLFGGMLALIVVVFGTLTMRENYGDADRDYRETIRQSYTYFIGKRDLKLLTLAMVLSSTAIFAMLFIYQPYMVDKGLDKEWLGLYYAAIMVSTGVGSACASKLLERIGRLSVIVLAALTVTVSALGLIIFDQLLISAVLFMALGLGHGLIMPILMLVRNDLIPSDLRASVLSLMSTLTNTMSAAVIVSLGYLVDVAPTGWVMAASAIASLMSIPVFTIALAGPSPSTPETQRVEA
jgi:MFS family permease